MVLGDSLVPDFVSALQLAPKCHWGSKTLAEDLSVKGGSLLELLAEFRLGNEVLIGGRRCGAQRREQEGEQRDECDRLANHGDVFPLSG